MLLLLKVTFGLAPFKINTCCSILAFVCIRAVVVEVQKGSTARVVRAPRVEFEAFWFWRKLRKVDARAEAEEEEENK